MIVGAIELAAAAAQQPEREQGERFAVLVPDFPSDAKRLPEILLGQIPLPEAIADQSKVLIVPAHAGVESGALIQLERLFQEPRGLAPLPKILVDDSKVVECADQPFDVVDAAEGGGRILQPLDRLARSAQAARAHSERHPELTDRA